MKKVYRKCNKTDCNIESEVGYHKYKNDTFHLAMICSKHGYTCLPYEELNIRDFQEIRKEFYIQKRKKFLEKDEIRKANRMKKRLLKMEKKKPKSLTATELLSL